MVCRDGFLLKPLDDSPFEEPVLTLKLLNAQLLVDGEEASKHSGEAGECLQILGAPILRHYHGGVSIVANGAEVFRSALEEVLCSGLGVAFVDKGDGVEEQLEHLGVDPQFVEVL